MAQYPALIKRPVLDTGDALLVGFAGNLRGATRMTAPFAVSCLKASTSGARLFISATPAADAGRARLPAHCRPAARRNRRRHRADRRQLKQPGRLTLQLRGNGPIQLLVMDCNEQLQMRGMARSNPVVLPAPVPELLGAHQGGGC